MADALQIKFNMDPKQWARATAEYERIIQKAETLAIRDVGDIAVEKGRQSIEAAGFSERWQKSLVARMNQRTPSFNPSVTIHSTISYSDVFETGKDITPVRAKYLWIPLPAVPSGHGQPHLTVKQYLNEIGPLVFMRVAGKAPMLGAQTRVPKFGKPVTRARLKRGRFAKATSNTTSQTVPMFVGVSAVHIPKKFDIAAACETAVKELDDRYEAHLEEYK